MSEILKAKCPECESLEQEALDRRDFIRVVGGTAATVVAAGTVAPHVLGQADRPAAARQAKPAEAMIQELFNGMNADQRRAVVLPWNDRNRTAINPNHAINNQRIGDHYRPAQQELIERILRAISSGQEGFDQLCRREPSGAID